MGEGSGPSGGLAIKDSEVLKSGGGLHSRHLLVFFVVFCDIFFCLLVSLMLLCDCVADVC